MGKAWLEEAGRRCFLIMNKTSPWHEVFVPSVPPETGREGLGCLRKVSCQRLSKSHPGPGPRVSPSKPKLRIYPGPKAAASTVRTQLQEVVLAAGLPRLVSEGSLVPIPSPFKSFYCHQGYHWGLVPARGHVSFSILLLRLRLLLFRAERN